MEKMMHLGNDISILHSPSHRIGLDGVMQWSSPKWTALEDIPDSDELDEWKRNLDPVDFIVCFLKLRSKVYSGKHIKKGDENFRPPCNCNLTLSACVRVKESRRLKGVCLIFDVVIFVWLFVLLFLKPCMWGEKWLFAIEKIWNTMFFINSYFKIIAAIPNEVLEQFFED